MSNLSSNVEKFRPIIEKYSKKYNVPVEIIGAVIMNESSGNPSAWNPSNNENSRGLMQISESTAKSTLKVPVMMLDVLFEPDYNIQKGTYYLGYIRDKLNSHCKSIGIKVDDLLLWFMVTGSYNQGMGYYMNALSRLKENNESINKANVVKELLRKDYRNPWPENVKHYAAKVISRLPAQFIDELTDPSTLVSQSGYKYNSIDSGSSKTKMIIISSIGLLGLIAIYLRSK